MKTDVNGQFVGKVAFVTGAASGINQPAAPHATDVAWRDRVCDARPRRSCNSCAV